MRKHIERYRSQIFTLLVFTLLLGGGVAFNAATAEEAPQLAISTQSNAPTTTLEKNEASLPASLVDPKSADEVAPLSQATAKETLFLESGENNGSVLGTESQSRLEQSSAPAFLRPPGPQPCNEFGNPCTNNNQCAEMCQAAGCEMTSSWCYNGLCHCCLI